MPNNMTLTQSYEAQRDLLTEQRYKRGNSSVTERSYTYNALGIPDTRRTARKGTVRNDTFGYNARNELTEATLGSAPYAYDYDNIGNRKTAQENAEELTYTANDLNQYTQITDNGSEFIPEYDAGGNQTRIRTSSGIWSAEYNAQNRAIRYTRENSDGTITVVTADYDSMGRRTWKKVETITPNPETGEETTTVTLHHRYIYRGYLQIATCDLTRSAHPCLWLITWESPRGLGGGLDKPQGFAPQGRGRNGVRPSHPTQPIATRPLAIQKDRTWYCYGWDLTKNICEIYSTTGYILTYYAYTPYGEVTTTGNTIQPIQWSSEFSDNETGLVYYNYRHYNPTTGRWLSRDNLGEKTDSNLYIFVRNNGISNVDQLGEYLWLVVIIAVGVAGVAYTAYEIYNDLSDIAKEIPDCKGNDDIQGILDCKRRMLNVCKKAPQLIQDVPGTTVTGPANSPTPNDPIDYVEIGVDIVNAVKK